MISGTNRVWRDFCPTLYFPYKIPDAKSMASSYNCKYTETSAALNHNVDELLVGVLTQIRLKQAEKNRFRGGGKKAAGRRALLSATGSSGSGGGAAGGGGAVTR